MRAQHPPETPGQAASWERVRANASEAGLCTQCAGQLAWGTQNGFATVKPPCERCAPIVAQWPQARLSGWRTVAGALSGRRAWVDAGVLAERAPRELRRPASVDERLREREG